MNELRTVAPFLRPYRFAIAAGLALIVVSNGAGVLVPALLGRAIDSLGVPGATFGTLLTYASLIIAATVVSGAARFGMRQLLNSQSRRVETDLRRAYFEHLLRLDATFHGTTRTGDLMARATNDTQAVRMAIGPGVMYFVNTIIMTAFALAFMIRFSPSLTALSLLPLALLPTVMIRFGRIIHRRFEAIQDHFGKLTTMVQENLSGVRIVRAYQQEAAQQAEFRSLNEEYVARNMALARTSAIFHPLLSVLAGAGLLIVLWFGGLQVMRGQLTAGEFVAFGLYLGLLTWPMIALGWVINLFQRGAASMGRLNRIFAARPAVTEPAEPQPLPDVRGTIEFHDVSFRYPGTERWVLRAVSFRIPAGATAALVGPTGSGKSTIAALLTRRYDPTEGEITLDGVPLRRIALARLRQAIGYVPQEAFVFSETIAENIALGIPDGESDGEGAAAEADADAASGRAAGARITDAERQTRVLDAAAIAQLTDTIAEFPHGFQTRLGERGINLSGGQRQRATLARALARDPRILVLDDALSAVDTHTEVAILEGLQAVLRDRTSLIISHRISAVMNADPILVLDEGHIVERGRHPQLIAAGGTYTRLLERQLLEEGLDEATPLAGRVPRV